MLNATGELRATILELDRATYSDYKKALAQPTNRNQHANTIHQQLTPHDPMPTTQVVRISITIIKCTTITINISAILRPLVHAISYTSFGVLVLVLVSVRILG